MNEEEKPFAVITGASSGIGEAFALGLALMGFNLMIIARRENKLQEIAKELRDKQDIDVLVIKADLSKIEDIDMVYEKLRETENITLLINNAGFGVSGSFIESDLTKQIDMINVHNIASFQFCKAVLPQMIERNTGTIINVSSIGGLMVKYG
ncbi:MAG: SDR family NAD(P)-dependent oxidoreductase, partial [Candidatus Heimdallarchaeota archaeon]|nr:SDR family NAD(P)-dependent oxidoreductase [Candidatus Heimdallarchaeota archaeon]MCK4611886.1 SDR family NAD(P)-dependent oxidoreductase [Candidatus Heimdallarchaeota archaeon]